MTSEQTPAPDANTPGTVSVLGDLLLGAVGLVVGCLMVAMSLELPDSPYEPAGPSFLPLLAALVLTVVSIGILAVAGSKLSRIRSGDGPGPAVLRSIGQSSAVYVLFILYAWTMAAGVLSFRPATFLFMSAASVVLVGLRVKQLAIALVLAGCISLGIHAIFTHILSVPLP